MIRYLLVFIILIFSIAYPQSTFQKTYGGIEEEYANAFVETYDGGFMIAASTRSYGAGNYDLYIIRTNQYGDTIWTKTFGNANYDYSHDIIKTDSAEYLIGAYSGSAQDGNILLLKIDDNGNVIWTKIVGTEENDHVERIIKTSDGGFALCGDIESGFDYQYLIWKFNSSGDSLWAKTYDFGRGMDIYQTTDGGYMMTVFPYAMLTSIYDFQLVKFNSIGDTLWTRFYGGPDVEVVYSGEQTPDGGFIMAGRTDSYGSGYSDFYLIKTDENGNPMWDKTFGGDQDDRAFSMSKTSDNGFIIGGYTESFNVGYFDFYMVKTNSDGDTLWTRTYGDNWQEEIYDIKETSDGGFAAIGYTHSFGAGTNPNIYFVKTDASGLITVIEENENISPNTFKLYQNYPNPFNPSTNISWQLPKAGNVEIILFNCLGEELEILVDEFQQAGLHSKFVTLNSKFPSGVYFYQLRSGNYIQTKKMIYLK